MAGERFFFFFLNHKIPQLCDLAVFFAKPLYIHLFVGSPHGHNTIKLQRNTMMGAVRVAQGSSGWHCHIAARMFLVQILGYLLLSLHGFSVGVSSRDLQRIRSKDNGWRESCLEGDCWWLIFPLAAWASEFIFGRLLWKLFPVSLVGTHFEEDELLQKPISWDQLKQHSSFNHLG